MPPSSHVAARIFHDLVNHELRVPPDIEAFDAHFDGDSKAAEEGLVLYHIVRWGGGMSADYIPHVLPEE
jgi:hypothetical protein